MRSRPTFWIVLVLLCVAGAWLFWRPAGDRPATSSNSAAQKQSAAATPGAATVTTAATATPNLVTPTNTAAVKTNEFAYRLSNTRRTIGELKDDPRAVLLANALIDSRLPLNFSIPKHLQSAGDPGTYIVQARGPVTAAFRKLLAGAGAQIISYVPNNAYLVRVAAAGVGNLSASPLTASVMPYEPYYKIISPSLLGVAVKQKDLPDGTTLNLGLFADNATETVAQIEKMGGKILATASMPFGPMVRVMPPVDWTALAVLPGVHIVEPYHVRIHANDLSRATTGVAVDSTTNANYLNLNGANVTVQVNDSGIDATHPDLTGRVFGAPTELVDTVGHGTFVAGEIGGDGTESLTVTNASGSVMPATNGQFRGKAPLVKLFAMDFQSSDQDLQQAAALTNALISNNSWNFDGDTLYDIEAASYDAATRDSLPLVTGSQPVLFVFSAGNGGGGGNDGLGGTQGSILSPATAKNVIAAGSLEQQRNITNYVTAPDGSSNQIWLPETDTSFEVAGSSSRGNVGVGIEGPNGRYKPDVVSPGVFVVSTRSQQWDQAAYYYQNITNSQDFTYENQTVEKDGLNLYSISVPLNAVGVRILMQPDGNGPLPPDMPIYVQQSDFPDPVNAPGAIDFSTANDQVSIPPDSGGAITGIQAIQGDGFFFAVGNSTNVPVLYNLITQIITTNNPGDEKIVLSNLNESIGPWYRYESGTSMAAADVSGMLALIQDYFTNTLQLTPSPALLKALLVNGARAVGNYNFNQADSKNYQGWGLVNLPNSVPGGTTNATAGSSAVFYVDQSPTNALATGDSHTYFVTISSNATALPFRVTVGWTDPPGNPAAAIKLVNNLDLIVSNMATNFVYYGNDIPVSSTVNEVGNTNSPVLDTVNNLENVFLPPLFSGTYSVTVVGRGVNVNAVTAQSNNIVQDYALVISSGGGLNPGTITVTDQGIVSNPTGGQLITDVVATNQPLFDQMTGAHSPLLGTNQVAAGGNTGFATNAVVTVGQTNQWHFYVVTNNGANANFTNAAFITFLAPTLSIPRMGVFADSVTNATTRQADIDMYVAGPGDPNAASLTNLDPTVISNCVHGANGDGASLSRGGTEFVVFSNSAVGQIYYVGVKSEVQMASEYAFLPVFTDTPFSQLNPDGSQTVNGIPLPVAIPDGSNIKPGAGYVFGIAIYPMQIQNVTVSNQLTHQQIGDLVGLLEHDGEIDVLNNHYSTNSPPAPGPYDFLYDDSQSPLAGSQPSAGGGLGKFVGQEALGVWQLTEVDDAQGQTGAITGFSLNIQPHIDPTKGVQTQILAPGQFFTTYVDVPVGATNLTIYATNRTVPLPVLPVELFVRYNVPPTQSNYDAKTLLDQPTPAGAAGSISIGATNTPPLRSGRYFFSLFNPSVNPAQIVDYFATIGIPLTGPVPLDFSSSGPTPLPDDAVTTSSISVPAIDPISAVNVGIRVDHPRISDLIFHLISPDGTRYLLMENRGGLTTNGAGLTYLVTNTASADHDGNAEAYTNTINTGTNAGTFSITYNFYTAPDRMVVYYGTSLVPSNLILDTGYISNPPGPGGAGPQGTNTIPQTITLTYPPLTATGTSTEITIIMNPGGNTNFPSTAWTYTVTSSLARYAYLTFIEDTNLTTTPIKFAPPPFVPTTNVVILFTNEPNTLIMSDGFEHASTGAPNPKPAGVVFSGWTVGTGDVDLLATNSNIMSFEGTNFIDLNGGVKGSVFTNFNTVIGKNYGVSFAYCRNSQAPLGFIASNTVSFTGNTNYLITYAFTNSNAAPNWQTTSVVFTATSALTTLQFSSLNNGNAGMFLDAVSVSLTNDQAFVTNYFLNKLDYLPEQSLTPLLGTSPTGNWQLEVQDNRVGAYDSNNVPMLLSWQMEFVLAQTNALLPPVFTNPPVDTNIDELKTFVVTNSAVPGKTNLTLTYSVSISVDTNAMLLNGWPTNFAGIIPPPTIDANGVIMWTPSETQGPGVYIITTIVTDNGSPSLAANNSFSVTVNEVNRAPVLPIRLNRTINALNTLTVVNTATDPDIPVNPLTYLLSVSPGATNATISTNGIITWTPTVPQATNIYTFQTIVTDTNVYALTNQSLSATNSFTVTVLPPLSLTNDVPVTNSIGTGGLTWYQVNVPANADFATNLLLFAAAPLNIWFSTNLPPTITSPPGDVELIANATSGSVVLGTTGPPANIVPGGIYYLGVENPNAFPVPNYAVEVDFHFSSLTNTAPFWPTNPPDTNINELATLIVTNTATDTDSPPSTLTYTVGISVDFNAMLANGWPTNYAGTNPPPTINGNGIITWIPSETQGPGVYIITTIVTDTNTFATTNQTLSATNSFAVTVNETNRAPFWLVNPPSKAVNELTLLTVTNTATDTDIPTNQLTYTVSMTVSNSAMLANGWPTNYAGTSPPPVIDPNTGIITWTPSETQGPGVYTITTIVTDTNLYALTNQSLSATNSFTVTVNEVNTAPFFTNNLPTNTIAILTTLTVTNTATDTDSPPNTLTYSLLNPPTNAVINSSNGIVTWTPPAAYANTTNIIQVVATDFSPYAPINKNLKATNSFVVIVLFPPFASTLAATAVTGTNAQLNGMATPNGLPAFAWFEWGTSSAYGNRTTNVNVGSGKGVVYVTNKLGGLSLPQAYHFRLVTSNSLAVTHGFDQIFDVGGVTAWGDNGAGQTNVPVVLTNITVAVAGGFNDSLALRNNARPIAWGDNTFTQTNVPASVTNAVAVAAGGNFNLALRNTGRVVAWGYNGDGETNVPASVSNVVAIAGGGFHSLALRANGTVVAWGWNIFNETNVPAGLTNVVAVAAGLFHSLALKNDGTVVAWGSGANGETNVPAGLNDVVAIAAGQLYSLALRTNGTVVAWGNNNEGETNVPAGLSNVVAIAAGSQHCLALKSDGTVVAWGDDTFGQTDVPANLINVAAIAGGGDHSLALVSATPVNLLPNTAPFFVATPADQAVNVLTTVTVTNTAIDLDVPTNTLVYTLSSTLGGPNAASINASNGVITWTPMLAQAGLTNFITTIVTDNGVPQLSATNSFAVIVNPIPGISSITATNLGGFNGFLLQWYAPTNDRFQIQWTAGLTPPVNWHTFTNIIGYTGPLTPTNGLFSFFDDGSQTGGLDLQRFYRLILLGSASSANTPPALPSQSAQIINPLNPFIVTNTATDADFPAQTLTYNLSSTVVGPNLPVISTNGIITWTPSVAQAGTSNLFTTIVTDNGAPPLSATNSYSVLVNPAPSINRTVSTNGGFLLTWLAPTNDVFALQVTTNLAAPAVWQTLATNIAYTGPVTPTNGWFSYLDDGTQIPFGPIRFYRLILAGVAAPTGVVTPPVSISGIISTNGNFLLTWSAPTNEQFNVRWTTNLVPPVSWTLFPDLITSTNGTFTFMDTNAPLLMKFYELILLP